MAARTKIKGYVMSEGEFAPDTMCEECGAKATYSLYKTIDKYLEVIFNEKWIARVRFTCFEHRNELGKEILYHEK